MRSHGSGAGRRGGGGGSCGGGGVSGLAGLAGRSTIQASGMALVTLMRGRLVSLQLASVATALASKADKPGDVQMSVPLPVLGGVRARSVASELQVLGGAGAPASASEAARLGGLCMPGAADAPA